MDGVVYVLAVLLFVLWASYFGQKMIPTNVLYKSSYWSFLLNQGRVDRQIWCISTEVTNVLPLVVVVRDEGELQETQDQNLLLFEEPPRCSAHWIRNPKVWRHRH